MDIISMRTLLTEAKEIRNQSPVKALEILKGIDLQTCTDASLKIEIYQEYIYNLLNLSKQEQALDCLEKIRQLIPEVNDRSIYMYYHKIRGIIFIEKGDFSSGLDEFSIVLDLAHQLDKPEMVFVETINIGVVFSKLKKFEQALHYFNQAAEIAEDNDFDKTDLLLNMIASNAETGKIAEAIDIGLYLEKKLQAGNNIFQQISWCINMGNAYSLQEDYEQAVHYFEKANQLIEDTEQEAHYNDVKYQLAVILTKTGKISEAIELLEASYKIALEQEGLANQEKVMRQLGECYNLSGEHELAYKSLQKAFAIHEAIIDESTKEKIARYQATLEVEHKLKEKDQLMMIYARQAEMGQMIAAIAHQWRQPLNGLSVIFDSIYDAWEYNELTEDSLNNKIASGKEVIFSMNNTIKDFRSFFQVKQQYDIFNIREVIEKSIRFTDYRFRNENIKLEFEVKDNCLLSGSSNQLLQVVLIILNNAFDAYQELDIKNGKVKIYHEIENNYSCLRIVDNAGGIPNAIMEEIFTLNFSTKSDEKNSGIGLYLAKMIIEHKFNGSISVDNENEGAVFLIKLPLPSAE
jgi:signal transduction histidine kinase